VLVKDLERFILFTF